MREQYEGLTMSSTTGESSCLDVLPDGARLAADAQGQNGTAE